MSLRSSEKQRVSSCPAADAIARAVIARFRGISKDCAAIEDATSQMVLAGIVAIKGNDMHVISLAVGNKFNATGEKHSNRVRDCHAEVLARRAFKLWLLKQYMSRENNSEFFEKTTDNVLKPHEGIKWVLYVSSCPCGNACIRRWGDSPKEIFDYSLDSLEMAKDKPHPAFHPHSQKEGQTAISMKGQSTVLSCSDKILRWNVLGLHGIRLSGIVTERILLDGIVIGRKFVRKHAERAFCCRLSSKKIPEKLKNSTNHPSLMCTALKLDDGAIKAEEGATFTENVIWWNTGSPKIETIDGTQGLTQNGDISELAPSKLYGGNIPEPQSDLVDLSRVLDSQMRLL